VVIKPIATEVHYLMVVWEVYQSYTNHIHSLYWNDNTNHYILSMCEPRQQWWRSCLDLTEHVGKTLENLLNPSENYHVPSKKGIYCTYYIIYIPGITALPLFSDTSKQMIGMRHQNCIKSWHIDTLPDGPGAN
jgi:hypothetical protein